MTMPMFKGGQGKDASEVISVGVALIYLIVALISAGTAMLICYLLDII